MIIRCNACGFVNGVADEATAFCPNCGAPYAAEEGATVMAGPPPAQGTGYGTYTPYPSQPPLYTPTPYPAPYSYAGKTDFGPPPPPPAPPRPKGGMGPFVGGMMVMLGIVVLALCGLVAYAAAKARNAADTTQGQTSAPTTSQTAGAHPSATKAPLSFQQYNDPHGKFTITYPATWSYQAKPATGIPGTLTAFTPVNNTTKALDVAVTSTYLTTGSLETIIKGSNGTNYVQTQKPITSPINGVRWRKVSADFMASDGTPYHAVELVWRHDLLTYLIVMYTPQGQFDGTQTTVFNPMLQSFTAG